MKKAVIITVSVLAALFAGLLLAPLFFKGTILGMIKQAANENLSATLDFTDADASLLRDFPRLSVKITQISLANLPPSRDTLFRADAIETSLDLWTLLAGSRAEILALRLENPVIFAHIAPDSAKNWEITKPDGEKTPESGAMRVQLRDISITGGSLTFLDEAGGKRFEMRNLTLGGSADYSGNACTLTSSLGAVVSFAKSGLTMLDAVNATGKATVAIDLARQRYTLSNNEFRLNDLPVTAAGWLELGEDYMDFDLTMGAASPEFAGLLSVLPKMYAKQGAMQAVSGNASVAARLKGRMDETNLPGFSLGITVSDGAFQGKQSPVAIRNIAMNLAITNPDGKPDNTVIDLKNLAFTAGGDPFSMRALVRNPVSNPYVDAAMKGTINLGVWKKNMTLQPGADIDGTIAADVLLRGRVSAIRTKNFSNFTAAGTISATNLTAVTATMPAPAAIRAASLTLSPQFAALSNLDGTIGASDFRAEGRLDNIVGFMLADEDLTGSLTVNSRKFDCNPWLGLTKTSGKQEQAPTKPIELPGNIDFAFAASAGEALYDNITARNVTARLRLRDKMLTIEHASMDAVGGNIVMSGTFDTRKPGKPHSKFDLRLTDIDIASAYKTFGTAQAFAPFLEFMRGKFDAGMNLDTDLGSDLKPDFATLSSLGGLNIERIAVEGFKPFSQAAGLLKLDALSNPSLANIASKFVIEKGRFTIPRTALNVGGYDAVIQGSNGLDKTMDYTLTLNIPAGTLPQKANQALGSLLKKDITAFGSQTLPVDVRFGGTFGSPTVSVALGSAAAGQLESAANALKAEAQRKLDEEKAKIEQRAREEEQKLQQRAKEEEDRLRRRAREEEEKARAKIAEEQERLKKKAEEEAKKKAEEAAKKLLPNPFKPK